MKVIPKGSLASGLAPTLPPDSGVSSGTERIQVFFSFSLETQDLCTIIHLIFFSVCVFSLFITSKETAPVCATCKVLPWMFGCSTNWQSSEVQMVNRTLYMYRYISVVEMEYVPTGAAVSGLELTYSRVYTDKWPVHSWFCTLCRLSHIPYGLQIFKPQLGHQGRGTCGWTDDMKDATSWLLLHHLQCRFWMLLMGSANKGKIKALNRQRIALNKGLNNIDLNCLQ